MKDAIKKMESMMTPEQIKRSNEIYQEELVKDKVRAVLALMKPEWQWAARDYSGEWVAYVDMPFVHYDEFTTYNGRAFCIGNFDLPPFPGDWRDSLVEREE